VHLSLLRDTADESAQAVCRMLSRGQ